MNEKCCQHCGAVTVRSHGRSLLEFKSVNGTWWDPEKSQMSGTCKRCGRKWAETIGEPILPKCLTGSPVLA